MPNQSAPSGEQRYGRPPPKRDQQDFSSSSRGGASSSSTEGSSRSSAGSDSSNLQLAPAEQVRALRKAKAGDGGYAAIDSQQGAAASGGHFVWRHTGKTMASSSQTLDSSSKQRYKEPPQQDKAQDEALEEAAVEQSVLQEAPTKSTPEELEALRQAVPKDANGQPTSIGSMKHEDDTCKPCLFFITQVGCGKGVECTFCHFPHNRRARTKPSKSKRERCKKIVDRTAAAQGARELENHGEPGTSNSKLSL